MPVFQQQATTMPAGLVKAATSPAFAGINQALVDTMDQYLSDPSASTDAVVQALTSGVQKALQS
jgi:multiple sugar transport system substrate-binding protein